MSSSLAPSPTNHSPISLKLSTLSHSPPFDSSGSESNTPPKNHACDISTPVRQMKYTGILRDANADSGMCLEESAMPSQRGTSSSQKQQHTTHSTSTIPRSPRWRITSPDLTEMAPHGLHTYCCLNSIRPPCLQTSIDANNVYTCEYRLNRLTGTGMHRVKQFAKQDAAVNLLSQLYPMQRDLREIYLQMDREIASSEKNLKPLLRTSCMDPCQLLNEVVTFFGLERPDTDYLTEGNLYVCKMSVLGMRGEQISVEHKDINERQVKKRCASDVLDKLFPEKTLDEVRKEIDVKRREKEMEKRRLTKGKAKSQGIGSGNKGGKGHRLGSAKENIAPRYSTPHHVGPVNVPPQERNAESTLSGYPITTVQDPHSGRKIRVRLVPVDPADRGALLGADPMLLSSWTPFAALSASK